MAVRDSDINAIETAAADLVADLRKTRRTLATAESVTGGLIGSTITSVPGASEIYRGGIIAYSMDAKVSVLGVPEEVCARGLITEEVAVQMAIGAYRLLDADLAVSCTGVAGPDWDHSGPSPVGPGTIWLAVASEKSTVTKLLNLSGSREEIRLATTHQALFMLSQN